MKRRISVITGDEYLWQKIYLILKKELEVFRTEAPSGDLCLFDVDTGTVSEEDERTVRMSRTESCALPIPFTEDELISVVSGEARPSSLLVLNGRCARLYGEEIRLTEVESALLSVLISAGGEFVSRECLLSEVWHGQADGGVLNVYVHYLREKLERRGEKIIVSSRRAGYKIDAKFLTGGGESA